MKSTPKKDRLNVEIAAGGIVWNKRGRGRKLAVIHRSGHKDWSLPKGKLEPDETPEQGALREVREEIGVSARVGRIAGITWYRKLDRPKLVIYWHMVAKSMVDFKPNEEVNELRWLGAKAAMKLLTYKTERELLRREGGRSGKELEFEPQKKSKR